MPAVIHRALPLAVALLVVACRSSDLDQPPPTTSIVPLATPVTFDAVYVVNGEGSSISVIDASQNRVAGTIELKGLAYPHHVSISPNRALLGVAVPGYDMSMGEFGHEHHSSRPGRVLVLDATTGELRASTMTTAANNNVAFSPDGAVWTSMATQPGSTLVLDANSLEIREAMSVGTAPAETALAPDGQLGYVANSGSASVSVIDVPARRVKSTIKVGAGPVFALPSTDGNVYVENEPDRTITIISQATLSVVRTFELGFTPGAIAVNKKGGVFVTAPARGIVEHRDAEGRVLSTVNVGRGAHWVVFSEDESRMYVSNELEDTVSVVDLSTMAVLVTIPVGAKPNGMVWRTR